MNSGLMAASGPCGRHHGPPGSKKQSGSLVDSDYLRTFAVERTNGMKELVLVCIGSFFGGGARYVVGRLLQWWLPVAFPWGTLTVNVVGCFFIGLLSGLSLGGTLSSTLRLVLVTGFCGGFTTFSTFMNENLLMAREGSMLPALLYTLASLVVGLLAVVAGYQVVR